MLAFPPIVSVKAQIRKADPHEERQKEKVR
jgi:hypothetical protein